MQPDLLHQGATLIDLLCARAEGPAQTKGYTFLGTKEAQRLTYLELDREARRVATHLQMQGSVGQRALLLFPPGLPYIVAFWGCLYAGIVAVPAYTPRSEASLPRLQTTLASAEAHLVLSTSSLLERLERFATQLPQLALARRVATDALDSVELADWRMPPVTSDSLAFLQYTSGSITSPKGVMLSHRNLLHNLAIIHQAFDVTPESRGVSWLPPYHDMGLIGMILEPLYAGSDMTLLSPFDFLQSPLRWLQAISETRATISGGPNFAYSLCVDRIRPEQRNGLDLSCWSTAFSGAEPIRSETLERFSAAFAECGFRQNAWYPCYGLAEASLMVSGGPRDTLPLVQTFDSSALERHEVVVAPARHDGVRTLVGCGEVLGGQEVQIVDLTTGVRLPAGAVGEIWVHGSSVAQGYWELPAATDETFRARTATGAGPFLRTGDLGFFHGRQLFVTGRIKDLIIIRGRNLYPQDLEWTALNSHPALLSGDGAAITIDRAGQVELVIIQEVDRRALKSDLVPVVEAIRQAVTAEHTVQVAAVLLLKPGQLPRTSSGKVQRHICRQRFLNNTFEPVYSSALGNSLGEPDALSILPDNQDCHLALHLRRIVAPLLRVEPAQIPLDRPLVTAGLDSLTALELQFFMEQEFAVQLPLSLLLDRASLHDLARVIGEAAPDAPPAGVEGAAPHALAPLSHGQRALWFLHQLEPESTTYNIPVALRLHGQLDGKALEQALRQLGARHAMLRTRFVVRDGEPFQQVLAEPATLTTLDATDWGEERQIAYLEAQARQPFDLSSAPPIRLILLVCGPEKHLLVCVIHHILVDFWSMALLLHDLEQMYAARRGSTRAVSAPAPYQEYVSAQRALLASGEADRLWNYWREQLANGVPSLDLPTDRPRGLVSRPCGGVEQTHIDPVLTAQIAALSRARGVTRYTTMLAVWATLLYRYTSQRHIVIGSPLAGRQSARWADVVGYFVNPVPLVFAFAESLTFAQLLAQTHRTLQGALAHQGLPLPVLVERLQQERPQEHLALFQAMVVWEQAVSSAPPELALVALGTTSAQMRLDDLMAESVPIARGGSQAELTLVLADAGAGLEVVVEYNSNLFDAATVQRLLGHFRNLMVAALAEPDQPLRALPLLDAKERVEALRAWQAAPLPSSDAVPLQRAFEQHAASHPADIALIHYERYLSYRELNERAEQLADWLHQRGLIPEQRVGVLLERSPEQIALLLAILKAGTTYVPLDPAYPAERLAAMLDDSCVALLVTHRTLAGQLPPALHPPETVFLEDLLQVPASRRLPLRPSPHSDQLAYIIYTSGSTGRPKGVAITHRSACALVNWARSFYTPSDLAVVLAATSICFDLSIFEIFVTLSAGGTAVLARDALDLDALASCDRVTLINTVPSAAAELLRLRAFPKSLRVVNLAGEPLTRGLADEIYSQTAVERVYNLYGPTEDTTYSTIAQVERSEESGPPPIGMPINGTAVYLLDARLEPVPTGVIGEIYLNGAGLARGYLHRPDLTAERFLPDPLSTSPGARMYRTGDLAYARADSQLMFVGRQDHQIKLRGYRIELGEIESVLVQHPEVRAAAACVWDMGANAGSQLLAYVVAATAAAINMESVRAWLQRRLPAYMLPARILVLDALPLTQNGKLDRKALPAPDRLACAATPPARLSTTPTERAVAAIWQDLLSVPIVELDTSFFSLGGHSLLVSQMQARISDALQIDLPLRALFESPTVSQIAQMIDRAKQTTLPQEDPPLAPIVRDAYRRKIHQTPKGS